MKRISFLPAFFACLIVVLAGVLWVRLTSHQAEAVLVDPEVTGAEEATPTESRSVREAADSTIVNVAPDGSPLQENSSTPVAGERGLSAREQRYNELLRSAPPAAPSSASVAPATTAAEPSLLSRVVAPIADALGIDRARPSNVPVASRPQQQARTQPEARREPSESQSDSSTKEPESPREPKKEIDPDTDEAPPTLMGAEFLPAQVQDGEETTLALLVTDNLSGVRSVSGVIASPSGGLQGFSARNEGGTSRYLARILIPKKAAEGIWSVRYVTLTDNASNNVNLNAGQGGLPPTAQFRVTSSSSDSKPPTLADAWIERPDMRSGERNTIFVKAEDDKSGVGQISGTFVSPNKSARLGFACKGTAGGVWECVLAPPSCLDCGLWELEQIQLQDAANNTAIFRLDNPAVAKIKVGITGEACDATPPTIQSIVLNPTVVSNAEGGTIRVEALLADEGCGVASLNGQATPAENPGGQRAYFSFEPSGDGKLFTGSITIPKHSAKGVWSIAWIQAVDKGHNIRSYPTNDPVITRVTFTVD
jgi:hypothetical protein